MSKRSFRVFVGDFETTVYDGQTDTEVWASASVELGTEDVEIFNSIEDQFKYFLSFKDNLIVYYHNLKFDGNFWLSYLLKNPTYSQAYTMENNDIKTIKFIETGKMKNNTFKYSISDMGQWYSITIKHNNKLIELRDSYKLLPFKLETIGKNFDTKHKKSTIEYKGERHAGGIIKDEEKYYISNDVLVIKEALEIMFMQGHTKLTIGACCLSEYKEIIGKTLYQESYPNLYERPLDEKVYGSPSAGEYIRKSYRGGWCYLAKGKEHKKYYNGTTADVNSLYPSMMHSESGNYYPIGLPTFWKGNYIPAEAQKPNRYFFVRINTRFYIKPNMLPFIQIKNTLRYNGTEMLETSDMLNVRTGKYTPQYIDLEGNVQECKLTITMTQTDYYLLLKHYDTPELQILDGCYFDSEIGIFDNYINKYREIKINSTGAIRELAKLFLNNLYGKMASSTDSSFKVSFLKDDGSLGLFNVKENDKVPGYIPIGSAITSYARAFTITAAQANYYGPDKPGFIYADTDSIHCDLPPDSLKGVKEHPRNFCCWKFESCWDYAYFTRQKTYIEHITHKDREPVKEPYYDVKCAGMPEKSKNLFIASITKLPENADEIYSEEEIKWAKEKRKLEDFKIGLSVPGKLVPRRIPGGVLLVETPYVMR